VSNTNLSSNSSISVEVAEEEEVEEKEVDEEYQLITIEVRRTRHNSNVVYVTKQ